MTSPSMSFGATRFHLATDLTFCSEHLSPGIKVKHDKSSDFMKSAHYISSGSAESKFQFIPL